MTATVKVWDRQAKGGPAPLEMYAVRAKEAVARDPQRYSLSKPGDEPPPAPVLTVVPPAPAQPDPIPEGWESLPWQDRRKLAVKLGAARNCNSDIANAIIAAEASRRANANSSSAQSLQPEPAPAIEPAFAED